MFILYMFIIIIIMSIILVVILSSSKTQNLNNKKISQKNAEDVYVFIPHKKNMFNMKAHDIIDYFKQHFIVFDEEENSSADNMIEFIKKHKHTDKTMILYNHSTAHYDREHEVVDFLNTIINVKLKIVFVLFDHWISWSKKINTYRRKILSCQNCYVTTFAHTKKELEHSWGQQGITITNPNIIYNFSIWSCYKLSNNIKFNKNPKNIVCVTGAVSNHMYPDRKALLEYQYVEKMLYTVSDNYIENLNNYICVLYTSVYVPSYNGYRNTHLILLKLYEILSSGALLLIPLSEKDYVEHLGLFHKKNCWILNMNNKDNIQNDINYIVDVKNKKEIDSYRLASKKLSLKYTSDNINDSLMKKLFKILY